MNTGTVTVSKCMAVDLELGRRWWMLPLAVIAVPLCFRIWAEASGFNWGRGAKTLISVDVMSLASFVGLGGVPYATAVLNLRGAKLWHRVTGLMTLLFGTQIATPDLGALRSLFVFTLLAYSQYFIISYFHWPRWRISNNRTKAYDVSISSIFVLTAVVAILVASAINLFGKDKASTVLHVTAVTLVLWFVGCILGTYRHRRFAMIAGNLLTATLTLVLFFELIREDIRFHPLSMIFMLHAIVLASPWAISYFHRSDRKLLCKRFSQIPDTMPTSESTLLK